MCILVDVYRRRKPRIYTKIVTLRLYLTMIFYFNIYIFSTVSELLQ